MDEMESSLEERFEWLKLNPPTKFNTRFVSWAEYVEREIISDLYCFAFNHPYYCGGSGMTDDESRHCFLDDIGVPRKVK